MSEALAAELLESGCSEATVRVLMVLELWRSFEMIAVAAEV